MKLYRTLDKELYACIVYYTRIMAYLMLLVSLGYMIWPFWGMHWITALIVSPFFVISIWMITRKSGRKAVKIQPDHIQIFYGKRKLLKTMKLENVQFLKQSVEINILFGIHAFDCLVFYDGANDIHDEIIRLIDDNGNGPFYIALDKMENFLVIQNPEVISLLEQMPTIQEKLHASL